MVWNYLFTNEDEKDFDSQLLELIKERNNKQVESFLQNTKNLCTAVDISGSTLLHYAAEFGNETVSHFLLKSEAKVNLQNKKGQTPLILATTGNHEDTVRLLLENNADIYLEDNDGVSALQLAVQGCLTEMFLARLKSDCSESDEMAKRLLKVKCPLYVAVRLRDTDLIKCMLNEGSSIDAADPESNQTALHVAVRNRLLKIVKLLVNRGANVNALDARKQTALSLMRSFPNTDILEILVNGKTDLTACTEDGFMQVYSVFCKGTREAVKIIAKSGLKVQASDLYERTVIHYLASNVNKGIVGVLEEWIDDGQNKLSLYNEKSIDSTKPIDWNARDKDGLTALHYAVSVGNEEFVKYLIKKGAQINITSIKGVTPFLKAVDSTPESTLTRRVECVKILLANGADPEVLMNNFLKFYDNKPAVNLNYDPLEPVVAHLALREAQQDEPFDQEILSKIEWHPRLKECFDKCASELEWMKKEKIFNSSVTLFDILARNEKAMKYLKGCERSCVQHRIRQYESNPNYRELLDLRVCEVTLRSDENTEDFSFSLCAILYLLIVVAVLSLRVVFGF